jgi:fumarylpyruvate hydrolase
MPYPSMTKDLHHEMELVVAIGAGGVDISIGDALEHVWGYCAGLDMTRRDLQGEAKKTGRPWDMGKGFDLSAPMGAIMPKGAVRPVEGPHPAQRERRAAPGERPVQADLVGARGDRQPFDARAPDARRPHHDRHAENVAAVQRGDLLEGFVEGVGEVRTGSPDLHETAAQFRGDPGKGPGFRGAAARQGEASPGLPGVGLPWS